MVAAETSQKSGNMFAIIIRTALFLAILFTLFRTEFFQYSDAFTEIGVGVGCISKKNSQQNHPAHVLSLLFLYGHAPKPY